MSCSEKNQFSVETLPTPSGEFTRLQSRRRSFVLGRLGSLTSSEDALASVADRSGAQAMATSWATRAAMAIVSGRHDQIDREAGPRRAATPPKRLAFPSTETTRNRPVPPCLSWSFASKLEERRSSCDSSPERSQETCSNLFKH